MLYIHASGNFQLGILKIQTTPAEQMLPAGHKGWLLIGNELCSFENKWFLRDNL
jgi:hypothetical protein